MKSVVGLGLLLSFFGVSEVWAQCGDPPAARVGAYQTVGSACSAFLSSNPTCTCLPEEAAINGANNGNTTMQIRGITNCSGSPGSTGSAQYVLCDIMIPIPPSLDPFIGGASGTGSGGGGDGGGGPPGGPPPVCSASSSQTAPGSIIDIEYQGLGEEMPLVGLPFSLMYHTAYVKDRVGFYKMLIPVTNSAVHPNTTSFHVEIFNEASVSVYSQAFSVATGQSTVWTWNGNLNSGAEAIAAIPFRVRVREFNTVVGEMVNIWTVNLGEFKANRIGLGHWLPSIYKFYDPVTQRIVNPSGNSRKVVATLDTVLNLYKAPSLHGEEYYEFDLTGRLVRIKTGITGQMKYEFSYDGSGRLTQIQDAFSNITTFNRNGSGVWTSITTPYGKTISVTIDADSRLQDVTFPSSDKYEMTYYSTGGLLATFKKPNLATSTFTYDSYGNLTQDAHSSGYVQNLVRTKSTPINKNVEYSQSGRTNIRTVTNNTYQSVRGVTETSMPSKSVSYGHNSTLITHAGYYATTSKTNDLRFGTQAKRYTAIQGGSLGSVFRPESYAQSVTLSTPSNPFSITAWTKTDTVGSSSVSHVYNPSLKKWTSTNTLGATTNYTMDVYERTTQAQRGNLNAVNFTYTGDKLTQISQGTRTSTYAYSGSTGLLTSVTNPYSQTTSYAYDSNDRLATITRPDSQVINIAYDSVGRLASIQPVSRPAHTFTFGANEKVSVYTPPTLVGITYPETNYTYDNNRIKTVTRPDGKVITFNYNSATGRLSTIVTTEASYTITPLASNALPSSVLATNRYGIYYTYQGRIPSEYYTYSPASTLVSTYTRAFNTNFGFVSSDTVSAGTGTSTIGYTYDNGQNLKTAGDMTFNYNTPNGQMTTATTGTHTMTNTYDAYGAMLTQTSTISGTQVHKLTLTYDSGGRIATKKDDMPSVSTPTYTYTYDNLGRLTYVDDGVTNLRTYSYDLNGNRTQKVEGLTTTNYTYDDQDRLLTAGVYTFTYNAQGEILTKTNTLLSQTTTYTYDSLGNLTQVNLPGGNVITYDIDVQNRRIAKRLNGTLQVRYIYSDQYRISGETNSSGNLVRRFIYGSKRNIPDYYIESSVKYRLLSDQLGSPRVVINQSTGATIAEFDHDEFGIEVANTNTALKLPFGFAGGLYDADTGLLRFGARDYDPQTGRWLSKDPILFNGGDANLYGYVMNDPVNFVDPLGLWSISVGWFGVGVLGGPGGSITIGQNPGGGWFGGVKIGVGIGGGFSIDPNGSSPEGCKGSGISVGPYFEAGANFGPLDYGFGTSSGYNQGSGPYYNPPGFSVGGTPSVRVGAGVSGGFQFSFH